MHTVCIQYSGFVPMNDKFLQKVATKREVKNIIPREFSFFNNIRKIDFLFSKKTSVEKFKGDLKFRPEYKIRTCHASSSK